jgi:anti-sigma factor RsiW
MLCSDLERYLEAFLDGRLGRSRMTILRRHLGMCGPCRARVEQLRRFEREVVRQMGSAAAQEQPSLWHGLEADLVRSFTVGGADIIPLLRPSPPTSPRLRPPIFRAAQRPAGRQSAQGDARWRASRLAGVVAIALAVGAIYEMARAFLGSTDEAEAATEAYLAYVTGKHELTLRTDNAGQLQRWLADEFGYTAPPPAVPSGFRLVGATRAELGEHTAAIIVFAPSDGGELQPTLLFIQPSTATLEVFNDAAAGQPVTVDGYNQLNWEAEPYSFRLVSAEPAARLRAFAP